jgi:hypothetical protein
VVGSIFDGLPNSATPRISAYRHWPKWVLDKAINEGELRLSAAEVYANIEQDTLRDRMEFKSIGRISRRLVYDPKDASHRKLADDLRFAGAIDIGPNVEGGILENIEYVDPATPAYIFSMSLDSKPEKFDMVGHEPKDAVTFIPDVGLLANVLCDVLKGAIVPPILYDLVAYRKTEYEFGSDPVVRPDPFNKPLSFAPQREVRLVVYPNGRMEEHITARSPVLCRLFSEWAARAESRPGGVLSP